MKKLFTSKKFIFTTLFTALAGFLPSVSSGATGQQKAIADYQTCSIISNLLLKKSTVEP